MKMFGLEWNVPVTPQHTLAVSVLALFVVIGIWDIVAYIRQDQGATVSNILAGWAREFPIFAVAIGAIVGHLFWPLIPPSNGGPR